MPYTVYVIFPVLALAKPLEPHFIWLRTSFGSALHLDPNTSLLIGKFFTRAIALSGLMGMTGAFFVLLYSPIKSFIMGSDPRLRLN